MPIDLNKLERKSRLSRSLKQKLIENLDIHYEPEDLSDDISLVGSGLGLDSLDILEIVLCVENNFGVKLPEENLQILRSFNTLLDFVFEEGEKQNA